MTGFKSRLVWAKMDCHIDADHRIARFGEDASVVREVYLFVHRRVPFEGKEGGVSPGQVEPAFLARMLYIPMARAMVGLIGCLTSGLLSLEREGMALRNVTDALRNALPEALRNDEVTKSNALPDGGNALQNLLWQADFVRVTDWARGYGTGASYNAEKQKKYRDRKRLTRDPSVTERYVTLRNGVGNAVTSRYPLEEKRREEKRDPEISLGPGGVEGGSEVGSGSKPPTPEPDQTPGGISLVSDKSETVDSSSDDAEGKRSRRKSDRIPDPAWWAADGLRRMVCARNPSANIAVKSWDNKPRPPNAIDEKQPRADKSAAKVTPCALGRVGNRMKWADEIRLIVDRDKRTYDEVWETMEWLMFRQPAKLGAGFIVESPTALREKWGAIWGFIQEGRRRPNGGGGQGLAGVDKAVEEMKSALLKSQQDQTVNSISGSVGTQGVGGDTPGEWVDLHPVGGPG